MQEKEMVKTPVSFAKIVHQLKASAQPTIKLLVNQASPSQFAYWNIRSGEIKITFGRGDFSYTLFRFLIA
jgi:hypothetical protein